MASPDQITITYVEFDETRSTPITALTYVEWDTPGKSHYAHADEAKFNTGDETDEDEAEDSRGNIEHRGIPVEVREALALLICPTLRRAA